MGYDIYDQVMDSELEAVLHDQDRLREIDELGITSQGTDDVLQELAATAAREIGLGVGLVSVVLDDAQYFAAMHGVEGWICQARGTPIEWSFCKYTVDTHAPLVIEDARNDERVADNPLVTIEGFRCYAGIPLVTSRGHAIGTLCVLGNEPHTFTDDDLAKLKTLADQALERIEAGRAVAV